MKERNYRTSDQRIADLESKIAAIRQRDERRKIRAHPAVRQAVVAARAIAKALALADGPELREKLVRVDAAMRDVVEVKPRLTREPVAAPKRRQRTRRAEATA